MTGQRTLFIFLLFGIFIVPCRTETPKHDWDILIFTQHWPITVCLQWREASEQHSCSLPLKEIWTIHGIWPTKLGTKGPQFCNSSLHFNITSLDPIKPDLEKYWMNIYNNSEAAFWKHEWKRHGTCAASLPALDSELKYFSTAINLSIQYNMYDILSKGGILLDSKEGFTSQQLSNAIRNVLAVNPEIQCIEEKGVSYLFELRICFNKTFNLVDCDGIKSTYNTGNVITNCPTSKPIFYPSKLPPLEEDYDQEPCFTQHENNSNWPVKILQIVQFLQWFTF